MAKAAQRIELSPAKFRNLVKTVGAKKAAKYSGVSSSTVYRRVKNEQGQSITRGAVKQIKSSVGAKKTARLTGLSPQQIGRITKQLRQPRGVERARNYTRSELARLVVLASGVGAKAVSSGGTLRAQYYGSVRAGLEKLSKQISQTAIAESGGVSHQTVSRWINDGIPDKSKELARAVLEKALGERFAISPEKLESIGRAILEGRPTPRVRVTESFIDVRRRVENDYIPKSEHKNADAATAMQNAGDDFYKSISQNATGEGKTEFAAAMAETARAILRDLNLEHQVTVGGINSDLVRGERMSGQLFVDQPGSLWQLIDYLRGARGARPIPSFFVVQFQSDGAIRILEPEDSSGLLVEEILGDEDYVPTYGEDDEDSEW